MDDYLSNIKSSEGIQENRIEVEMLQNALHLTDKKLRECMIPRTEIIAMDVNASIQELKEKFIKTKLSKILIFKGNIDKVIGYVHSSDLFRDPHNIRSVLLPIPFVPESMFALELLNQFQRNLMEKRLLFLIQKKLLGKNSMIFLIVYFLKKR